jgi:hypothetical protein
MDGDANERYDTPMDGLHQTAPYNPPGVLGTEASMLEHVFQCHGVRWSPMPVIETTPQPEVRWKAWEPKLWRRTPQGKSRHTHKSYGD